MRPTTSHRRWAWLGVLFIVLGGVLGMHALGTHGLASHGVSEATPDHDAIGHSTPLVPAASVGLEAGHPAADSVTAATSPATSTGAHPVAALSDEVAAGFGRSAPAPDEGDVPMGAMVQLCLAVLLAGAVMAWALATRAGPGASGSSAPRCRWPLPAATGTHPP